MKVSNLSLSRAGRQRQVEREATGGGSGKAGGGGGSDSEDEPMLLDEEEEEEEEEARLHVRKVAHTGGINRVRAMPQQPAIVASFADSAQVQVRARGPVGRCLAAGLLRWLQLPPFGAVGRRAEVPTAGLSLPSASLWARSMPPCHHPHLRSGTWVHC